MKHRLFLIAALFACVNVANDDFGTMLSSRTTKRTSQGRKQ